MYRPRQITIPDEFRNTVVYQEYEPPANLKKFCYYFWELRTAQTLTKDFWYWILPDACTDSIFDLDATNKINHVFVMASAREVEKINLGRQFHYVGLRFLPGVLQTTTLHDMPAAEKTWHQLKQTATSLERQTRLTSFARTLLAENKVRDNYLMRHIMAHSEQLRRVSDLAAITDYTPRQLQRIFRAHMGLTPSSFIQILRFQDTLKGAPSHPYADQSHLIKEYKRIAGVTPRAFKARHPMSDSYNTQQ